MKKDNYCIYIEDNEVPVSQEVYEVYMRSIWREQKQIQREKNFSEKLNGSRIVSLDAIVSGGGEQYLSNTHIRSAEEIWLTEMDKVLLHKSLKRLELIEKEMICEIFWNKKSLNGFGKEKNLSRRTSKSMYDKTLKKLKFFYKEEESKFNIRQIEIKFD